jgi:hypothetical protein
MAIHRRSWEQPTILKYFFKSGFRETFRPLGYQTVDAFAGSRIQYCFHTASNVAVTRRFLKV